MTDVAKTQAEADACWTCRECKTPIADVQPETWLAVPCGHYVTHVQMVTMTYGTPSWPVTLTFDAEPEPRWTRRRGQQIRLFGLDLPVSVVRALLVIYPILGAILLALMAYGWVTGS